jgi:predicted RNase H-like nuclease (RuvC/YqgF family)
MVRRSFVVTLVAALLGVFAASGSAVAADRRPVAEARDHRAVCERLEDAAQALRARIGEIQATQERIRAKIASGELRPAQEARAKHALRKLEALQQELEEKLARVLALHQEKCRG